MHERAEIIANQTSRTSRSIHLPAVAGCHAHCSCWDYLLLVCHDCESLPAGENIAMILGHN